MSESPGLDDGLAAPPLGERGFWAIFAAGWLALAALYVTVGTVEGEGVVFGLRLATHVVLPPVLLSLPLALGRRWLVRPERSVAATLGIFLVAGVLFSTATALATMVLAQLLGFTEPGMDQLSRLSVFVFRTVSAALLYVVLAGFLMWTESLRRVHESRTLAAREAVLRAQAEAKALRAQFNPHFVFNTLHSLMLLVRADPAAAERAIEDVATLIRYASILQRREVDVVPLTKELAVARTYVGLEKLRLEDRLRTTFEVEVDPAKVSLPAFALQTLLENAIKHGLEPSPEGGSVRIRVEREDDRMVLTVADDGAGAEAGAVERAEGHGLDLLRRRLDALYGEEGSLVWSTAPGEGFRVVLRIPWRPAGTAAGLETIPDAPVTV